MRDDFKIWEAFLVKILGPRPTVLYSGDPFLRRTPTSTWISCKIFLYDSMDLSMVYFIMISKSQLMDFFCQQPSHGIAALLFVTSCYM
jgi:hypothetical protein